MKTDLAMILSYRKATRNPIRQNKIFEKILAQYFRMITAILIKKHGVPSVDIEDTIEYAVAVTALMEALTKYQLDGKYEFSTYLTHHIRLHLTRHFAKFVCGVTRFAKAYDTIENPKEATPWATESTDDSFFDETDESSWDEQGDCVDTPQITRSFTPDLVGAQPLYERLEQIEEQEKALSSNYSQPISFGLSILLGLSGYGKLGKIHVFKLIGTNFRKELTDTLDLFSPIKQSD